MSYHYTGSMVDLGNGRGWLDGPAAASQFRIDAELGHPQQITEAGRTWDEQNDHYQHYQRYGSPIALSPDTPSLHQRGRAKDTDERLADVRHRHGWRLTVYRWVNGIWTLVEPWHEEYFQELDLYFSQTAADNAADFNPFSPNNPAKPARKKKKMTVVIERKEFDTKLTYVFAPGYVKHLADGNQVQTMLWLSDQGAPHQFDEGDFQRAIWGFGLEEFSLNDLEAIAAKPGGMLVASWLKTPDAVKAPEAVKPPKA